MESIGTFEWRYTLSSIRPRGVVEDKSGNYTLWELPEYKQNNKPERVAMGLFLEVQMFVMCTRSSRLVVYLKAQVSG